MSLKDNTRDNNKNGRSDSNTMKSAIPSRETETESNLLETEWQNADPRSAPLLSEIFRDDSNDASNSDGDRNKIPELCLLPFHHLLSAELIARLMTDPPPSGQKRTKSSTSLRLQRYWQLLAAAGVTARELVLLDSYLICKYKRAEAGNPIENSARQQVKIEWEVNYHDELQGCAEIYRAELLFWKRLIYEAGSKLRAIIEFPKTALIPFLNAETFARLGVESIDHLFVNNLNGLFELTVSGEEKLTCENEAVKQSDDNKAGQQNPRRVTAVPKFRFFQELHGSRRSTSSMRKRSGLALITDANETINSMPGDFSNTNKKLESGEQDTPPVNETTVYRVELSSYWLAWQQAAQDVAFDFEYLASINDTRAQRFYELTKLWRRACSMNNRSGGESNIEVKSDPRNSEMPKSMEISYEMLTALMPLPTFDHDRDIQCQISGIVKPLLGGYLKSFTIKPECWKTDDLQRRIIFRFST